MATEKVENVELKHLGFVRFASIYTVICVSSLYDYAKQNSGPLRSIVVSVEGAVSTVVSPVFEKFKGVPSDLLVFADKKVDAGARKFDKHAPSVAKRVVSKAHSIIYSACEKAQALVHEAQVGGVGAAGHYAAAESKHLVLTQSVKVWLALDQIAPFHVLAEMVVPTAAHLSKKYNQVITKMARKGYTLFSYVPLVPIDEISREIKQSKTVKKGDTNGQKSSDSSSDSD